VRGNAIWAFGRERECYTPDKEARAEFDWDQWFPIKGGLAMHAREKESYIRSAVDASPHKIAIISCKDHYEGQGDHITVAFYDKNHNLVFAKMAPGASYSGSIPEKTFGSAEISGVTLKALASNYQTVEAVPLDFSIKHGAAADKAAELFLAGLEKALTGANASNTTEDALQTAIEKLDPCFGVSVSQVIGGVWANFKEAYPGAAEVLAKLLLKHVFDVERFEGTATDALAGMMKSADVILPKTFVADALQSAWDDLCAAFPEEAKAIAEHLVKTNNPEATDDWISWTTQLKAGIPLIVEKAAPSRESWAKENSSHVHSPEHDTWVDAGKQPEQALPLRTAAPPADSELSSPPEELMGRRHHMQDHTDLIETAVDASPTGVVIIGVRRGEGSGGASKFDSQNGEAFDHVLVAYRDPASGKILIAEMMPGDPRNPNDAWGSILNSKNNPQTLHNVVRAWEKFVAVPVELTPEQDKLFKESLAKNLSGQNTYSFLTQTGNTCSSGVRKALMDAGVWDWPETGFWARLEKAGINVVLPGTVIEWSKQKGGVFYDSDHFRTETLDTTDGGEEGASHSEHAAPAPDAKDARSADVARQPIGEGHDAAQKQAASASDTNDARSADAAQQPTDDDQDASQEQAGLASDTKDARSADAAQQPTDDDHEASQEQVALASDTEGARRDDASQQPAGDDDQDASQEEMALASDSEDVRSDDAAVRESAKAEVAANPTVDDQAGAQVAASAPVISDDGFSFSMFTKPAVPVEVAKEAVPAGQLSPEDIPGSGTPAGESALPEPGSEDVGNAAPSKEPVVHHGDLAP
jgi:hypothetical protein